MEKIMQVYFGSNGFPYKDKTRETPYPIVAKASGGSLIMGENNTTQVKFYLGQLGGNEHTWVANLKLPDGKLYYRVLESIGFDDDGEFYALMPINDLYTSMKGEVIIGVQGFRGGISYNYDEEDDNYEISGTPDIISTYVIKVLVNYAPLVLPHGSTLTPTAEQQILALLSSKADKSTTIVLVGDITTENANNYAVNNILYALRQRKFYVVDLTSDLTSHIFRDELIQADNFQVVGERLSNIVSRAIFKDIPNQVIEENIIIGENANLYKGSVADGNEYVAKQEIGVSNFDESDVNVGEKDIVLTQDKNVYIGTKTNNNKVATKGDLSSKQDLLIFDETPTSNSNNPVTSKGVKEYVDQRTGGGVEKIISDSVATTPNVALFNGQQGQLAPSESTYNSIYFVPKGDNTYVEYMTLLKSGSYVWEVIGTTDIDLSNYYNKDESDELFAKVDEENTFTQTQTFKDKILLKHDPTYDGDADTSLTIQNDGWSAHIGINGSTMYIGGRFEFDKSIAPVGNQDIGGVDAKWRNLYLSDTLFTTVVDSTGTLYLGSSGKPIQMGGTTKPTRTDSDLGSGDNQWKDLYLSGGTKYASTGTNNYLITSGDAWLNFKFNNTNIARMYVDNFSPSVSTASVDLGTDGYRWNSLYLNGAVRFKGTSTDCYITNYSNALGFYYGTNRVASLSGSGFFPVGVNRNLGSSGQKWQNIYLNGNIQIGSTTLNETELSNIKYNVSSFEYEYDDGTSETLDIRVA